MADAGGWSTIESDEVCSPSVHSFFLDCCYEDRNVQYPLLSMSRTAMPVD